MYGVGDVWGEWVGEVTGGGTDGENGGSLDPTQFSLLCKVEVSGGQGIKDMLGQGRCYRMTERKRGMSCQSLLEWGRGWV